MGYSCKGLSTSELVVSALSLLAGGFLLYESGYFIYAYNFTSRLWLFMMPMTTLVGGLVSGAFLTGSACALFFNKRKGVMLYRLSAILLMFFPINSILLDILYGYVQDLVLSTILFFPIGLFLYLFFRSKKYPKSHTAALFMIGVGVYLFIDPVFYDWSYF